MPPLPQLYFGPTLESVLDLPYPLDGLATYTEPRASEWAQAPSGVEDAWYQGTDYCLEGDARWLPYGPMNPGFQATQPYSAWEQFITWGRQRGARVRYVPDRTFPTNYVDGWLVEPFDQPGATERDGTNRLHLKLRTRDRHYGIAQRGLFYEYAPGASLTDPLTYTFSRASVRYYVGPDGYVHQDASGVLRDRHYAVGAAGLQTTLLEDAATNDVTNPEDLGNASWTKFACSITANNAPAPDLNKTADLVVEDTATTVHQVVSNTITITAGDTVTALGFIRSSGRYKGVFCVDNGADNARFGVSYDLSAGTIVSDLTGTSVLVASRLVALGGGWYFVWIRGTVDAAATTVTVRLRLKDGTGAASYTGDGASGAYLWGATAVHGLTTTVASYTPTTAVADSLKVAYTLAPQPQWFYFKFIETGQALVVDANRGGLLAVGCTAAASPALDVLTDNGAAGKYTFRHVNAAAASVQATVASAPAQGDTVELLGLRFADGSVQLIQALNSGAEVASAVSAALAIDYTAWTDAFLGLGMRRAGVPGAVALALFKTGPYGGPAPINTVALARAA